MKHAGLVHLLTAAVLVAVPRLAAAQSPADPGRPPAAEYTSAPRPSRTAGAAATPEDLYAETWWSAPGPSFELGGYFRVRSELMDHFTLGRADAPGRELWPQPPDNSYDDPQGARRLKLCGASPDERQPCQNSTQAGANMRLRINPELRISDNLRVMAQVDMLDNIVLGSTWAPDGFVGSQTTADYELVERGGYTPLGAFSTTQWAPQAGQNSTKDSILVKRVWAEYRTPVGTLSFGRMPSHWGLGILANSGDGHDSDWQSTTDRLMLVTGIEKYDLHFSAAWDFADTGATSASLLQQEGQDYDLAQNDDVHQIVFTVARRRSRELEKLDLAGGRLVVNGGAYFAYRTQELENVTATRYAASLGASAADLKRGYVRRRAEIFVPDLWLQLLHGKLRVEAEAAFFVGSLENTLRTPGTSDRGSSRDPNESGWKIQQFGLAAEADYRAFEDRLKLGLGFGYATGDGDETSLAVPRQGLLPQQNGDRSFTTFRFHPDYRVDLILFRNLLTRVQGAYYLRPSLSYDFLRGDDGQRLGGDAALVWSRASQPAQTPGGQSDLGVELDFGLRYQARDGSRNDGSDAPGGFFTSLQYGVLFPLAGLGHIASERSAAPDLHPAQMVRWYLGVLF